MTCNCEGDESIFLVFDNIIFLSSPQCLCFHVKSIFQILMDCEKLCEMGNAIHLAIEYDDR
jgi:hypothetical protein